MYQNLSNLRCKLWGVAGCRWAIGAFALFMLCAGPAEGASGTPRLTHEQMRADLIYVRDVWMPKNKGFNPAAMRKFDRIIGQALADVGDLDRLGFWIAISRALAVSGNGHTSVDGDEPPFRGLPFNAWWFRDGLYIVQTQPDYAYLLGARIEKIGRDNVRRALEAVTPLIAGTAGWVKAQSPRYLRIPSLLHRLDITNSDTRATLTVRLRDGDSREVSLPLASTPDPVAGHSGWRALMVTASSEKNAWKKVIDSIKPVPTTYRKPVAISTKWLGPGHNTFYIRSNRIVGIGGASIKSPLVQILLTQIAPRRPKSIIVDLRYNGGGNFANTILFAQALPKLLPPGGHIYVLVNSSTFSAAIVTAAMLKEWGGNKVVLLGTSMGDNAGFWAEGQPVALPHSHLELRLTPEYENWGRGCHQLSRCFWPNVIWGPKSRISLQPLYAISPTFAQYAAGLDPVLQKALELSRSVH